MLTYGLGAVCHAAKSDAGPSLAWILDPAYELAERVGAVDGEPGWIWQVTVADWASSLTAVDAIDEGVALLLAEEGHRCIEHLSAQGIDPSRTLRALEAADLPVEPLLKDALPAAAYESA